MRLGFGGVVFGGHVDELLQVLDPPLRLDRPFGLEGLEISRLLQELLEQVNEKDLDRIEAIVRSMTPAERQQPKIINGSRRLRIANGSGTTVGEVGNLVTRFYEAQRQMKQMLKK